MDQIINTFERIKVIRGVSNGNISIGQVQTIAQRCHLDEAQIAELNTLLSENGILPVPDSQIRTPISAPASSPKVPPKKELSPEVRAERFAKLLAAYEEALEETPPSPGSISRSCPC